VARTLAQAARAQGLVVPSFRSPPGLAGVQRSLRRRRGAVTVSVRLRERPWAAVVADMVEGVVVANRLDGPAADRARAALWEALAAAGVVEGERARAA
ncbi:MAG TPA: hypothetical protein VF183_09775, partial [Acidimicrobiales bacterium]